MAYRIFKGRQIRLSISNSYWPLLWPTPDKSEIELLKEASKYLLSTAVLKTRTIFYQKRLTNLEK